MTVAEARKICTPAEMNLLLACRPKSLEKLSADELKDNVVSARRLRDKWRDVATDQRRDTQRRQQARVTDDNARSREKSALFAHALSKFEDQLKNVQSSDGAAILSKTAPEKKPKKAERAQTHREVRSIARGRVKAARSEFDTAGKRTSGAAKKKVAKKPAAKKKATVTKPAKKNAAAPAKKKVAKKAAAVKTTITKPAKKKATKAPRKAGLVTADPGQQLSAKTAAKKSRIKASGLLARVRGHVAASGRRAQGKRDSRG